MSGQINFEVDVYSSRWGHTDVYAINLNRDHMRIGRTGKTAICSWVGDRDPKWSGDYENIGNPLIEILENDSVYPPTVLVRALEHSWMAWRDGTLGDQELQKEVQELFQWVNVVSKSKPNTEFWQKTF